WRVSCPCWCFFSSGRRHTRFSRDWSSDVCSSDLGQGVGALRIEGEPQGAHALPGLAPRLPADGSGTVVVAVGPEGGWAPRDRDRSEERRVGKEGGTMGARVSR